MDKVSCEDHDNCRLKELQRDLPCQPRRRLTTRGILRFTCIVFLGIVVYAGLHPFHAPANQVAWVPNADAVRFGKYGTILGAESFAPPPSGAGDRSIEIWVQPGKVEDSNTLVAFYSPADARLVSLTQAESDLEILIQSSTPWRRAKTERVNIADAFRDGKSSIWTVTFGLFGTSVYCDGALVRKSATRPSGNEISGRLVVGNSPISNDSWSGVLRGLAIYDSALDQVQIARHYANWIKGKGPAPAADEVCIALYLFNEHGGRIVHNRVRSVNDLYIPQKYLVLRPTVLDPVWRAFNWSRGFWMDGVINITGFIPFSCMFCAYFSNRGLRRPALSAAVLGVAVSVLIELTQTQLPTRDSSMSDLIDNIFGSVLGAGVYRGSIARAFDRAISRIVCMANGFQRTKQN